MSNVAVFYMLGTLCTSCQAGRMSYVGAPSGKLLCTTCNHMCEERKQIQMSVEREEAQEIFFDPLPPEWGPFFAWSEGVPEKERVYGE